MTTAAGTRSDTRVTENSINTFEKSLRDRERKNDTVRKYVSSVRRLMDWMDGREITPELLTEYRDHLQEGLKPATMNGNLTAINTYLDLIGLPEYRLPRQKIQGDMSGPEEG